MPHSRILAGSRLAYTGQDFRLGRGKRHFARHAGFDGWAAAR
jgi:hypothetical protein